MPRPVKLIAALIHAVGPGFPAKVRASLDRQAGPKYGTHKNHPGLLVRHDAIGSLTTGRIVNREFVPEE